MNKTQKYITLLCALLLVLVAIDIFFLGVRTPSLLSVEKNLPSKPLDQIQKRNESFYSINVSNELLTKLYTALPSAWPATINPNEIVEFDINNDGYVDAISLIILTHTYGNQTATDTQVLVTWLNGENGFKYYEGGYDEFRNYLGHYEKCSITDVKFEKIFINCDSDATIISGHPIVLTFQDNGVGYKEVVEDMVVKNDFEKEGDISWKSYISEGAGVKFWTPENYYVEEERYLVEELDIDFIAIDVYDNQKRRILSIHSEPSDNKDWGGGLVDINSALFIRTSDEHYLIRNNKIDSRYEKPPYYVTYLDAEINKVNNVGSIFNSYNIRNVKEGRNYKIFAPHTISDTTVTQADRILTTLQYIPSDSSVITYTVPNIRKTITIPSTTISFTVPVTAMEQIPDNSNVNTLYQKTYLISLPNQEYYLPASLTVSLEKIRTIEEMSRYGYGGYDHTVDKCLWNTSFQDKKRYGENYGCEASGGDGGYFYHEINLIDPEQKYILTLGEESFSEGRQALFTNLEKIAETVKWAK